MALDTNLLDPTTDREGAATAVLEACTTFAAEYDGGIDAGPEDVASQAAAAVIGSITQPVTYERMKAICARATQRVAIDLGRSERKRLALEAKFVPSSYHRGGLGPIGDFLVQTVKDDAKRGVPGAEYAMAEANGRPRDQVALTFDTTPEDVGAAIVLEKARVEEIAGIYH